MGTDERGRGGRRGAIALAVPLALFAGGCTEGLPETVERDAVAEEGAIESGSVGKLGFVIVGRNLPSRTGFASAGFVDLGVSAPREEFDLGSGEDEPADSCIVDIAVIDPFSGGLGAESFGVGIAPPIGVVSTGNLSAGERLPMSADGAPYDALERVVEGEEVRYERAFPPFTDLPERLALELPGDEFPAVAAVDVPPVEEIEGFSPGILAEAGEDSTFTWAAPSDAEKGGRLEIVISSPTQTLTCIVEDDGEFAVADAARAFDDVPFEGTGELVFVTRSVEGTVDAPGALIRVVNRTSLSYELDLLEDEGGNDPLLPTYSSVDGPPPREITTIGEIGEPRETEVAAVTLTRVDAASHSDATRQGWNSDESLLLVGDSVIDAVTYESVATISALSEERVWSSADPDTMYGTSGSGFYRLDVRSGESELLFDFSASGGRCTIGDGQGSPSRDDGFIVVRCDRTLISLDVGRGAELGRLELRDDYRWASFTPSGRWVIVGYGGPGAAAELVRYERDLSTPFVLDTRASRGDVGLDLSGRDVYVMVDSPHPRYLAIEDGSEVVLGLGSTEQPFGDGSVSCRAVRRAGWCYFSLDSGHVGAARIDVKSTEPIGETGLGRSRYQGVALWEHWGYHRASTGGVVVSASASPSGRRVMLNSDLGGSANTYVLAAGASGGLAGADACAAFPPIAKESITRADWDSWIGPTDYSRNSEFLSLVPDGGQGTLRQRYVAYPRGTERVAAGAKLPPSRTYTLSQTVLFEPGFEFPRGGKLAFGLGNGSLPSGGRVKPDGFTARFYWKTNRDGTAQLVVYSYQADRGKTFGLGHELGDFKARPGEWITMTMEVTANSAANRSDGRLRGWVNGELVLDKNGIAWQTAGEPNVGYLIYSNFFGGGDPSWSPSRAVSARFKDVCWKAAANG